VVTGCLNEGTVSGWAGVDVLDVVAGVVEGVVELAAVVEVDDPASKGGGPSACVLGEVCDEVPVGVGQAVDANVGAVVDEPDGGSVPYGVDVIDVGRCVTSVTRFRPCGG